MAPVQKKELAPGDSTVVELVFNTRASKGKVNKNARLTCNDSTKAAVTLDFLANIVPDSDSVSTVRFSPGAFTFAKDSTKYAVVIQNYDSSMVYLKQASRPTDDIEVKIKNDKIKTSKSGKIEFAWKGETPEFDLNRVITFDTGTKGTPRFSVAYTIRGTKGPKPPAPPQHPAPQKPPTRASRAPFPLSGAPPWPTPSSLLGTAYPGSQMCSCPGCFSSPWR